MASRRARERERERERSGFALAKYERLCKSCTHAHSVNFRYSDYNSLHRRFLSIVRSVCRVCSLVGFIHANVRIVYTRNEETINKKSEDLIALLLWFYRDTLEESSNCGPLTKQAERYSINLMNCCARARVRISLA